MVLIDLTCCIFSSGNSYSSSLIHRLYSFVQLLSSDVRIGEKTKTLMFSETVIAGWAIFIMRFLCFSIKPKIVEDGPLEEYNGITYDRG